MRFDELTVTKRNIVLNALLGCPQLQTSTGRDHLILDLPPTVRNGLSRAADARSDTLALVQRCTLYPGGTLYLLHLIAADGRTRPFQNLLKTLNTHLPPGPAADWNRLLGMLNQLDAALPSGPKHLPRVVAAYCESRPDSTLDAEALAMLRSMPHWRICATCPRNKTIHNRH